MRRRRMTGPVAYVFSSTADATARRVHSTVQQIFVSATVVFGALFALAGCGAVPLPVTHRPPSELALAIQINGQFTEQPNVSVIVQVFEQAIPDHPAFGFALPDNARLTCNGADLKGVGAPGSRYYTSASAPCPRQPLGGRYQITYTDEHGAFATATVPVPRDSLAMLAPLTGATVPVPENASLTVRISLPSPPLNGRFTLHDVLVTCGVEPYFRCGYMNPQLTYQATAMASGDPRYPMRSGDVTGPTASHVPAAAARLIPTARPNPSPAPSPTWQPETASMMTDGAIGTITVRGDFSRFTPGTGAIGARASVEVRPNPGGFADVTASYDDTVSSAITWTR